LQEIWRRLRSRPDEDRSGLQCGAGGGRTRRPARRLPRLLHHGFCSLQCRPWQRQKVDRTLRRSPRSQGRRGRLGRTDSILRDPQLCAADHGEFAGLPGALWWRNAASDRGRPAPWHWGRIVRPERHYLGCPYRPPGIAAAARKIADDFVAKSADNVRDLRSRRRAGAVLRKRKTRGSLMTSWKLIGLALGAALALSTPALAQDITIAVAGPMTGGESAFGRQMKNGADQAVADLNASGGVLGKKLALDVEDDAFDPKQARSVAEKIASAKIPFVAGHYCSSSSIPASEAYADGNVLQITPASTNPLFTERKLWNVARVCGRDDQQGSVAGEYIAKNF